MPYKDVEKQREAVRRAVNKHRQGITEGITLEGTDPRVLHLAKALVDPVKREKLIRIHKALDKRIAGLGGKQVDLRDLVRFGINGFTMREVGEAIEATGG